MEKLTREEKRVEEKKNEGKEKPYIPKQILTKRVEKVPTLPAPVRNRESGSSSEESNKPTYAKVTAVETQKGFTEVVRKSEIKKERRLEDIKKKTYVAPERKRRLSIRFNRRKDGKQGLPEEISTEMVRTRLDETLKELNMEGYFSKVEKTRMGDVHLCLLKTRAADIALAKNAMTNCMTNMEQQEFNWMPDTKKVNIYINDVPLMREGFGGN